LRSHSETGAQRWYHGVTRYQWLVLVIASLGWIFDVFEGQIFVASMSEAMPSLLPEDVRQDPEARRGHVSYYNYVALAAFLAGGAVGGVVFGRLSDRIGRTRTMVVTIATYSVFTFLSALSQQWWHLVLYRFLVAMGVGGEWAVASAMVAEVFPTRARAWSLAIFHASSVLGTILAIAAGYFVIAGHPDVHVSIPAWGISWDLQGWRLGFLLGGVPALLIIWIRLSLREPESWQRLQAAATAEKRLPQGDLGELFGSRLLPRTLVGVGLAAVGLATFWGVHIYGKDLMRTSKENAYLQGISAQDASPEERKQLLTPFAQTAKEWEMIGMLLVTLGGGLGLISFGPLCEWLGRRRAFLVFQLGGLLVSLVLFEWLSHGDALYYLLPIFGFLTLGMHAGFAVYFPELFPTRLRGTGTGICFNVGRVLAGPILLLSGHMQRDWNVSLENSAAILSSLFLLGPVLLWFAPETRGQDLE
jgi:MFS family permease